MNQRRSFSAVVVSLFGVWLLSPVAEAAAPKVPTKTSPEAAEFFEKHVRPVLAEHCFSCHSEKKQKGDLRLDSLASMLKGNDAGPVLVAGKPDQSRLIQAIRYDGDIKMPPKAKLPDKAIESLTAWVKMGAPWPEAVARTVDPGKTSAEEARNHWAFQPVRPQTVPQIKNETWPISSVDNFILAKLKEKNLTPSKSADRRTLIRRATFDLTGLPPTFEEIEAFIADRSPTAFAKVVDRLLASPHYGERWARHWLDIARYADTKGYLAGNVDQRYPYAYTYRDYVVRSLNDDLPYDQFILHQLAADLLPNADKRALAAMGFLTVGRRFLNNPHDIIDDRIDVVSRGLLGLTVTCARCHDHKYDPIPTKDYYSLYAVFAGSTEPTELPLIGEPSHSAEYAAFEKELKAKEQALAEGRAAAYQELLNKMRSRVGDFLLAANDGRRPMGESSQAKINVGILMLRRWQGFLEETRKRQHPVFTAWHEFAALADKEFQSKASGIAQKIAANPKGHHPLIAKAFAGKPPSSLADVAQIYTDLFGNIEKQWQEFQKTHKGATALPDADTESLRQILYAQAFPANLPMDQIDRYLDRKTRDKVRGLQRKVDELKATSPAAPPRAMVMQDVPNPANKQHVFVRGNAGQWGEPVPKQFLHCLAGDGRKPFTKGSGRLELAQAIASKDNPLTARVIVNRVWLHHFGAGLVRTPSDFGTRGEPPTHSELLDYLAHRFVAEGWSLKKLHRLIMLSSAYQQTSDPPLQKGGPGGVDPENHLLWRMNRTRLDFEEMRDAMLAVAGNLDRTVGGRAVDLSKRPFPTRRTLYGFIDRQNLPGVYRAFDFANPDATSPQRYTTTVPQQALFLMNSPFVVEQAKQLIARPDVAAMSVPEQRIQQLYRCVFGRAAEPDEVAIGRGFIQSPPLESADSELNPWEKYAQALLLSNEFAFVD